MHAGYTQADRGGGAITSKSLVNGGSNKVVNIASTKMMKKVCVALLVKECARAVPSALASLQLYVWLVTALPSAACAAANRAIGTR